MAVAGYFRVSKARDDMSAPDIYRGEIDAYCRYKKLPCTEVFSDIDYSGRKGAKPRPGLEALLERRTEFESIVIPKLSRFGRSVSDLARLFDLFDADGIGLVFLDLNLDTSTSQGRLLRNIMASFAEYESDVRSDYSRAAHSYLARNGRPSSGQPPFGYRYDSEAKNHVIHKTEAKIVRELFDRYLGGETVNSIARDLNGRHVRTSRDATWSHRTLLQMIENPSYAGYRRSDGELVRATWEPLIPLDTHEQAMHLRRATKLAGTPPRAGRGMYLLSGLIVCGLCGKNLHHSPEKRLTPSMYRCYRDGETCPGGGIAAPRAEEHVTRAFLERVSQPFAERALRAPRGAFPAGPDNLSPPGGQLAAIDKRMARVVELLVDAGPAQATQLKRKAEALEEERAVLESQDASREIEGVQHRKRVRDLHELRKRLSDLPAIFELATTDERREMLRLAIDRLELIPRPAGNPRGVGQPRGRRVAVSWADWLT